MDKFSVLTGLVAPLDRANVDTDQIIPKQFLKSIRRSGFGPNLFDAWRYLDEGRPDKPNADGSRLMRFDIDPFRKHCLVNGLDDIGMTLRHADEIRAFEERRRAEQPWLFG